MFPLHRFKGVFHALGTHTCSVMRQPYHTSQKKRALSENDIALDSNFSHFPSHLSSQSFSPTAKMPAYMSSVYWWAYLMPYSPTIFDHPLVVNAILWGNYDILRDEAIAEVPKSEKPLHVLQVACAYGSVTPALFSSLPAQSRLEVIDISTVQLDVVARKLLAENTPVETDRVFETAPPSRGEDGFETRVFLEQDLNVQGTTKKLVLRHGNAVDMQCYETPTKENDGFDYVLSFFLLHEVPEDLRRGILAEMFRVAPAGSKLVFIDYHEPRVTNPVRPIMQLVNRFLEPFADDLWREDILHWASEADSKRIKSVAKQTYFGGLYQKVVVQL